MAENKQKIKWRVNFFDIAVIVVVIAAVLIFLKVTSSRTANSSANTSVTYTVEVNGVRIGASAKIREGDVVTDNIRKFNIGNVVSFDVSPAKRLVSDPVAGEMKYVDLPNCEDVILVISAKAYESDEEIIVDGGYTIKAGYGVNLSGPDYSLTGYITHIERS